MGPRLSIFIIAVSAVLRPVQAGETLLKLPDFIERQRGYGDFLKMRQEIEIVGSNLKICRNIYNVSRFDLAMSYVSESGYGSGQFFTFFISQGADVIPGNGEAMLVPPPPRPLRGDSLKTNITSGGNLKNCKILPVDAGMGSVFVVSMFTPNKVEKSGTIRSDLLALQTGKSLVSNVCKVNFRRGAVRC